MHQNAPNRVLNLKKFPGNIPGPVIHFAPDTENGGEGSDGRVMMDRNEGERKEGRTKGVRWREKRE